MVGGREALVLFMDESDEHRRRHVVPPAASNCTTWPFHSSSKHGGSSWEELVVEMLLPRQIMVLPGAAQTAPLSVSLTLSLMIPSRAK